jgi:soluble lytic murein transglycosylase
VLSRSIIAGFAICIVVALMPVAHAAADPDETFVELREAARKDNATKAAELADRLRDYAIPSYVEYYRLKPNISNVSASEINAYLGRYAGSAIADRLRNDWLLELGKQRNWNAFDRHYQLFVLKDDLQLKCYALMSAASKGQNVAEEARELLITPKKYGEGCQALIVMLGKNGQFSVDDVWAQIRLAGEAGRGGLAENIAGAAGAQEKQVAHAVDLPLLTLARGPQSTRAAHETFIIALGRLAKKNHEQAAEYVLKHAVGKLTAQEQALAWSQIALSASMNLAPEAIGYWRKAGNAPLSIEGHEWKVRTALRHGDWKMVKSAIQAMPTSARSDPAWVYWLGRALAAEGRQGEANRLYQSISEEYQFYGQLALEELGFKITIPPQTSPVTEEEVAPMAANQGFARALKFFELDMRFEGVREWNWELRRMSERELLAAAEFARQNNVLDRMVNTSDRTKNEVDFTQRFPSPHRNLMLVATRELGLDMAWTYGLIRQESRFVKNAKSSVGASGLMQLMPATARFVARKIGMSDFSQGMVNDPKTNIALGTNYLKMVLNDLDGSQTMASAAYNAGPKRPRSWRSTLPRSVEGAIFAETIPFSETRGYVKNVLSNATYYAALFENRQQSLKARLGTVSPQSYVATALP